MMIQAVGMVPIMMPVMLMPLPVGGMMVGGGAPGGPPSSPEHHIAAMAATFAMMAAAGGMPSTMFPMQGEMRRAYS